VEVEESAPVEPEQEASEDGNLAVCGVYELSLIVPGLLKKRKWLRLLKRKLRKR
jgi:hypothetical protein